MIVTKNQVLDVICILEKMYPNAECELDFVDAYQLIVSVVLSAQTTDKQVNIVTKELFAQYPDIASLSMANQEDVEAMIKRIGMYKTKSKNIIGLCKQLINDFDGKVPSTMEELIKLPGVGRKTANVVMANGFRIPAIAVDTHVFRVANRIGFVKEKDVEKTELSLMEVLPKDKWIFMHHAIILHGRRVCNARNPKCSECELVDLCIYGKIIKD